jgi:hypothetical protein
MPSILTAPTGFDGVGDYTPASMQQVIEVLKAKEKAEEAA